MRVARRSLAVCLLDDRLRTRVICQDDHECADGDEVGRVYQAQICAIKVVDDKPVIEVCQRVDVQRSKEVARGQGLPNVLERAFLQHQLPLPCAPVTGTIVHTKAKLASLLIRTFPTFLSADSHKSPVRVEHDEVAFQVTDKIEFHLCELGIVGEEVLDTQLLIGHTDQPRGIDMRYAFRAYY